MRAPGKISVKPLFALLRARAQIVQMLAVALRTLRRHGALESAVVALEPLPARAMPVFAGGLWCVSAMAQFWHSSFCAAGAADHREGIAAAVEQNDRLLAAFERLARLLDQRAREELFLPGLLKLAAHVDQFDFGQRAVLDAIVHLDARVFALHRVLPAFKRGRGRAEHHDRAGKLGAHHGDVARVVARRLFLLVALVVLFVDEDRARDSAPAQRSPSACRPRWAPRRDGCAATARCVPRA